MAGADLESGPMDVYPSLTYRDVEAALEFLETAFGLEPVSFDEEGAEEIRFAAVRHRDGMVMVQPELPEDLHGCGPRLRRTHQIERRRDDPIRPDRLPVPGR